MSAKLIPDGAAITNHFIISFAPHVTEANATNVSGLKDEVEIIDGPDKRGYATGRANRQTLTVSIAAHDPSDADFMKWKEKCENGAVGHQATGTVTMTTAGGVPVAIYELTNCICGGWEGPELNMESGEVGIHKYTISFARAKKIGP